MLHRLRLLALVLLGLGGAVAGAMIAPAAHTSIGPLSVDVRIRPSLRPGVAVDLPPVGAVRFDTHRTPVQVQASIRSVDIDEARALVSSPAALTSLQAAAPDTLRAAALRALAGALAAGAIGGAVLVGLATRGWRGVAAGTGIALGAAAVLAAATALTFNGTALAQPRFTGLLSSAPYVQRRTQTLAQRLESYRSGLADFVQSVTTLYALGDRLPVFDPGTQTDVVTVLHISDIHLNPLGYDLTDRLVRQFKVDAVVDSGDLSTWGTTAEQTFVGRVGSLGVPYVFVRGNHDSAALAAAVGRQRGAVVLDGQVVTVAGLRMAGVADPRDTASEGAADVVAKDVVTASVQRLADVVQAYDAAHPGAGVQLAVVHDPTRLDALVGRVPLVLTGHLHARRVSVDAGTRVMIEGSTGGAGLTANGLQSLTDGAPVPLEATLLYLRRTGPDAGRLLAYDDVTVGGLGLTSVSIDRTVVPAQQDSVPSPSPTPTVSPSASGPTSP